jgi:hypothetical protein
VVKRRTRLDLARDAMDPDTHKSPQAEPAVDGPPEPRTLRSQPRDLLKLRHTERARPEVLPRMRRSACSCLSGMRSSERG